MIFPGVDIEYFFTRNIHGQNIQDKTWLLIVLINLVSSPAAAAIHNLKIHWWSHPPYTSVNESALGMGQMDGILSEILKEILPLCNISMLDNSSFLLSSKLYEVPIDFHRTPQNVLKTLGSNTSELFFPVAIRAGEDITPFVHPSLADPSNLVFVSVLTSPGAVHFYKMSEEPVASDLLNVILQGWPMLILIMLGAGYSGIMIWLLDRLWNDSHFPKPFLKGFWEGFWWAFVTMTTVGYGDTTPRSIQARMFGLVWIVVGVTILSVFTATVTTVLTQESLGVHHRLQGQRIGIVQGSEEFALLVRKGGFPITALGFDNLVTMLDVGNISGALYDQFSFSSQQEKLSDKFLVHKLIENEVDHGFLLFSSDAQLRRCFQQQTRHFEWFAFQRLADSIQALSTKTSSLAESAQSLFQPRTITYMWYGSIVWIGIFLAFIIWEFAYWRPKHRRRQAIKSALLKSRLGHPSGDSSLSGKNQSGPNAITMDIGENLSSQNEHKSHNVVDRKPSKKLPNGFVENRIPAARFYANQGFEETTDGVPINRGITGRSEGIQGRSYRSDSFSEVTTLEALIKRQKVELQELEKELLRYQSAWEQRVKDLRRLHKEERRKMLRLMDHDDLFRNDTSNIPTVSDYFYNDSGKLNNEESIEDSYSSTVQPASLSLYDL